MPKHCDRQIQEPHAAPNIYTRLEDFISGGSGRNSAIASFKSLKPRFTPNPKPPCSLGQRQGLGAKTEAWVPLATSLIPTTSVFINLFKALLHGRIVIEHIVL